MNKQQQEEVGDERRKQLLGLFIKAWKQKKDQKKQETGEQQQKDGEQEQVEQQQDKEVNYKDQLFSRNEYAQSQFWEDRYKEHKGNFDWYVEWPQLKQYLEDSNMKIEKESKILMVGCGNSKLSEQMYQAGYQNILSIDISQTCIERMQNQANAKGYNLYYRVMDATDTKFEDQLFDVAIDKGTLDALACGKQDQVANKLLDEMARVAKSVVIISHSTHKNRIEIMGDRYQGRKVQEVKVYLSGESELINIMRTHLKNKPLNYILKDKQALLECIQQYQKQQKILKSLPPEVIQEYVIDHQQGSETKAEENAQTEQTQQTQQNQEQQFTYDPRRQSYCYLYKII